MAIISAFTDFFLTFIAILLAISYFTRKKRDPRYPPGKNNKIHNTSLCWGKMRIALNVNFTPTEIYITGPPALPIIGNLLQLGTQPHEALAKWAKEYGPVFSFKRGPDE